jgi:hypothetical protein
MKNIINKEEKQKMTNIAEIRVNKDEWTDWETPNMKNHQLTCGDCGLVHNIEFNAIKYIDGNQNGFFTYSDLDKKKYRVKYRVMRDDISTDQFRTKHKKN